MKSIIIIVVAVLLLQVEATSKRVKILPVESEIKKVRMFPGDPNDDKIVSPMNLCATYAADSDMKSSGSIPAISSYCASQFGKSPDEIFVNDDVYPYKMCLVPTQPSFSNLQPLTAFKTIAQDSFNNTSNQQVEHSFDMTGSVTQTLTMTTTTTVGLSTSISFGVDVPDVLSSSFEMTATFSTSSTNENSVENQLSFSPSTDMTCDPQCFYEVNLAVEEFSYTSDFTVDFCLSGYARCSYNNKVKGHFWWYVLIDDIVDPSARCWPQQGNLQALTASVNSSTSLSKSCY